MTRISPQPGNTYKIICADRDSPHKEIIFKFINVVNGGQYEIEIDGQSQVISDFCQLCSPFACEVHNT